MSNDIEASGEVHGTMRATCDGRGAVRMESVYDTNAVDLWSALTEPGRLARWIADVEGDLRVGGSLRARFTSGWEGPGRVDVCDVPARLVVTLAPGSDEETVIEALLTPENGRTRLVVEERGIPLGEIGLHGAGWQVHVEDLTRYLGGQAALGWRPRWTQLTPEYQLRAERLT